MDTVKVPTSSMKSSMKSSQTSIFAVMEQPETIDVLTYLSAQGSNILAFNSASDDVKKRPKEFSFNKIHTLQDKFKYSFTEEISSMAEKLLAGENQTAFIYGADEESKDKILIGESQNPGLLMSLLAEIFAKCYKKEIQDEVTVKLSCNLFSDGKFSDIFGGSERVEGGNLLVQDLLETKIILGSPEIIVRNMKTALKIINICCRKITDRHEQKQKQTQNIIYTVKLQLNRGENICGVVNQYAVSKFHIIKLINPSAHFGGGSKSNGWFINFFNFLQSQAISKDKVKAKSKDDKTILDDFTTFLIQCALKGASHIYNFLLITNKTTSNQCLTAFKFNSYLQLYKTKPALLRFNIDEMRRQQQALQKEAQQIFEKRTDEEILAKKTQICEFFEKVLKGHQRFLEALNFLEYFYAIVLGQTCDKLNKYIFNEEIEDFYYSKKLQIEMIPQIHDTIVELNGLNREIKQNQERVMHILGYLMGKRVNGVPRKLRDIFDRLFQLYQTTSSHFFFQSSTRFNEFLANFSPRDKQVLRQIEQGDQKCSILAAVDLKMQSVKQTQSLHKKVDKKATMKVSCVDFMHRRRDEDELEKMFTNTNVCLGKYNVNTRRS